MARLGIEIANEVDSSLLKTIKDLNKALQDLQKAQGKAGVDAKTYANAMREERLEGLRLTNQTKEIRKEIAQMTLEKRKNKEQTQAAAGSYREAQQRLTALGNAIRNAENGFKSNNPEIQKQIARYRALNQQLKEFDKQMGLNYRNVGNYPTVMGGLSKSVAGVASSYLSITSAISTLSKAIDVNAKLSDSIADLGRTAGVTKKEAEGLVDELKKIDTRTSIVDLSDIAIIGGQLGIAKDEIVGFTQAVDMLSVVLSNEISGGVDAITSSLGKINGVFRVAEKEGLSAGEAMQKTGSAILALGQAGLATGDFLADFTQRVGGVSSVTGIALPTMLAYGAVLEEAGVSAEVAGTSVSKLLGELAGKRKEFFAIAQLADANLTLEEFSRLINTDASKALQKFFAGLESGGTTTTQFYDILSKAGINSERYRNAVLLLAKNQELLSERVELSTKTFEEGTLAAEQFALRNDTLSGSIDKLKNAFTNMLAGGNVSAFFKNATESLTGFLTTVNTMANAKSFKDLMSFFGFLQGSGGSFKLATSWLSAKTAAEDYAKAQKEAIESGTNKIESQFAKLSQKQRDEALKTQKEIVALRQKEYELDMTPKRKEELEFQQKRLDYLIKQNEQLKNKEKGGSATIAEPALSDAEIKRRKKNVEDAISSMSTGIRKAFEATVTDEVAKIELKWEEVGRQAIEQYEKGIKNGGDPKVLSKKLQEWLDLINRAEDFEIRLLSAKQLEADKKEFDKLQEEEKKRLESLLDKYATFEQQRAKLTKEANDEIAKLDKEGAKDRAKVAKDILSRNLLDSYIKQIEESSEFMNLEDMIQRAGKKNIKRALKMGKDTVMAMIDGIKDATDSERNELRNIFGDFFDKGITDAENFKFELISDLANEFANLVTLSARFGDNLGESVKSVGAIIQSVANLAKTIGSMLGEVGKGLASTGNAYAAIAGAVLSIFGTVWDIFEQKRLEKEKKIQESQQRRIKELQTTTNILNEQIAIMDKIYGTARIDAWAKVQKQSQENVVKSLENIGEIRMTTTYGTDYDNKMKELFDQWGKDEKAIDERLADIKSRQRDRERQAASGGSPLTWLLGGKIFSPFKDEIKNLEELQTWLKEAEKYTLNWKTFEDITYEGAADVRAAIKSGKFDETTAAELSKILDEWEIYKDAQRKLMEEFTGTSFESMLSDIESLFRNAGEDSGEAFSKGFDKIIEDALFKMFSREFLEEQVKVLYDTLGGMAQDGLDASEIAELRRMWNDIEEGGKQRLEGLREVLGTDQSPIGGQGIAGQIGRALTEDTAVRLEGIWRGMYDQLIIGNRLVQDMINGLGITTGAFDQQAHRESMALMAQMLTEIGRVGDNTEKLHTIDTTLTYIESGIATIARNTKPDSSGRDLGTKTQ